MILRRLGNKKKLAQKIQQYFPQHRLYIEPFFGAGGMYFHKPKAKYNIVNDQDSEVFNLFMVVRHQREELARKWIMMPAHHDLWNWWKENHEADPVWRAIRFLFYSNFGYMGMPQTMVFNHGNSKELVLRNLDKTHEYLSNVEFMNCDFRKMFNLISLKGEKDVFIYCDPPYLETSDNYESSFQPEDSKALFETLQATGHKWAMSEFDHPLILENAKEHGCRVVEIGERHNLGNRRVEVLVMNYEAGQTKLF